jgi:hypothetical protein
MTANAQTPRTDAAEMPVDRVLRPAMVIDPNFCRILERELAAVRGQLAEYEFAAEHDEFDDRGVDIMELDHHYTDALSALTERKAYSKSSCAQMIAEQSERAERAESALAAAKAEAEALREALNQACARGMAAIATYGRRDENGLAGVSKTHYQELAQLHRLCDEPAARKGGK